MKPHGAAVKQKAEKNREQEEKLLTKTRGYIEKKGPKLMKSTNRKRTLLVELTQGKESRRSPVA